MDNEAIAVKLGELTAEVKNQEDRIVKLEHDTASIHDLATSTAVMATEMQNMNKNVKVLTTKVEALEAEPGKRWKSVVEKIIIVFVGAVIGFVCTKLGLQ